MSEIINKETIKRGLATFVALMVLSVLAGGFAGSAAADEVTIHSDGDGDAWGETNNTVDNGTLVLDSERYTPNVSLQGDEPVEVVVDVADTNDLSDNIGVQLMDSDGNKIAGKYASSAGEMSLSVSEDNVTSGDYEVWVFVETGMYSGDFAVNSLQVVEGEPNVAPSAEAGDNQTVTAGDTVQFDASASTDADGDSLTYEWSFDDGSNATGATANQTFDSAGTYVADLTVEDSHGATATDTVSVTVEEQTHEVSFDVVDDGVVVENASVAVTDGSDVEVENLTTDANGSAVTTLTDGTYSYSATGADGATIDSGEVVVAGEDVTVSTADESESDTSGGGSAVLDDDDKMVVVLGVVASLIVALVLGVFALVRGD